ncbi:MAG: type II toxin-antitoxin system RelE/ParE family toxin [Acidobacteria bacterium]|nr:type II toxin-antitoxin system RelE/ParE family toxin [Acidobacteriota bacterium]
MTFVIRPAARDDIIRQFRYRLLEFDDPQIGLLFLESVEGSIETITAMPQLGSPKTIRNRLLKGLRSWPVRDFPDVRIYYLVQDDVLRVVRVLHGKQNVDRILRRES